MYILQIFSHIDVFGHITDKRTPSRPLGEVKLSRAWLVVRWVTTCEAQVLKAIIFLVSIKVSRGFLFFFPSFQRFVTIILLLYPSLAYCIVSHLIRKHLFYFQVQSFNLCQCAKLHCARQCPPAGARPAATGSPAY